MENFTSVLLFRILKGKIVLIELFWEIIFTELLFFGWLIESIFGFKVLVKIDLRFLFEQRERVSCLLNGLISSGVVEVNKIMRLLNPLMTVELGKSILKLILQL